MSWFSLDADGLKYIGLVGDEEAVATTVVRFESPPKIEIDTGIDWAVIFLGAASLLSSLVIGFFTYRVQRNQIRANAATLRNEWMEQLRNAAAEFLQCVASVANGLDSKSISPQEASELTVKKQHALFLQVKMKLYVGVSSPLAQEINGVAEQLLICINSVKSGKFCVKTIRQNLTTLEGLVVRQLEKAWGQAKGDLSLPLDK